MGASLGQGTGEPDESPGKSGTLPALQAPLRSRARPKTIGWRKSACEKERCAVSDGGVHGRYPARAAVAGSTLDGGQCGGRCRAPIHLASGEPRSDVVFCCVAASDRIVVFPHGSGMRWRVRGVLKGEGASATTAPKCTKVHLIKSADLTSWQGRMMRERSVTFWKPCLQWDFFENS